MADRICANCGTINDAGIQYCANCGYSLTGGPGNRVSAPSSISTSDTMIARRITGALSAGNLLGGRYRIVRLIGKGSFGVVYKATDERFRSQRMVAIK